MSAILRIYDPPECDERGVPLDWERCRMCAMAWTGGMADCPVCDGHGSLKAAALAEKMRGEEWALRAGGGDAEDAVPRCEDCGHPMSEGTWEPETEPHRVRMRLEMARRALARGDEPLSEVLTLQRKPVPVPVHYSPCDDACRHGGSGRIGYRDPIEWFVQNHLDTDPWEDAVTVEASWRPVDIRTLGWPHDLRPEKLVVLCLRCFAERSR